MAGLMEKAERHQRAMGPFVIAAVVLGLLGLPLAAWMDLRGLSERVLQVQASEIGRIIDTMRGFYATDVVGRVLASDGGAVTTTHNYRGATGAIPIPATLSIELGNLISAQDGAVKYRFVSDLPFAGREPHNLDAFEADAIRTLRETHQPSVIESSGSIFDRNVRIVTPVVMGKVCVDCHNSHPESPKTDWKVGDVRGIQEVSITQPIASNIWAFKYLLLYLLLAAITGLAFIALQQHQSRLVEGINRELTETNNFLATISMKIAKYLSPQVYKSIFSGQKDVSIATERKKLTIFFSDIKDFTATVERLQPEDLTALLNEYLTEMSAIALQHGATVDKFIGDAILAFFGDPETKGVRDDARACLRMAIDMQRRLAELNAEWRSRGIEHPFRARMGINTGYCNVGNFGSNDRMDYTIIGAEANLAARLQAIAQPGGIVIGYETFALVRDMVRAEPQPAIAMKGISREVIPYSVEAILETAAEQPAVIREHAQGLELFLDVGALDANGVQRTRGLLQQALAALDVRAKPSPV